MKTFREEKEQTIYFILDVSASQDIGAPGKTKFDVGREICGVLALSGAKESSHIGLIAYSSEREKFMKPAKGITQAYEIIYNIIKLKPKSISTDLTKAVAFALNAIRRRSVIIMISDFIDDGYFHNLKSLARKHDLVLIQVSDKRETGLPKLGIVPVLDKESGKTIWVNTSFGDFRTKMSGHHNDRQVELADFSRRHQVNYVNVSTDEDYVPKLLKLFKVRNKSLKSV